MIPLHSKIRFQITAFLEAVTLVSSFWIAFYLFDILFPKLGLFLEIPIRPLENPSHYWAIFWTLIPIWLFNIAVFKSFYPKQNRYKILFSYCKLTFSIFLCSFALIAALKMSVISRVFIAFQASLFFVLILSIRLCFSQIWPKIFLSKDRIQILIFGDLNEVIEPIKKIASPQFYGLNILGVLLPQKTNILENSSSKELMDILKTKRNSMFNQDQSFVEILNHKSLEKVLRTRVIDEALIFTPSYQLPSFKNAIKRLEDFGINYHLHLTDIFQGDEGNLALHSLSKWPLLSKQKTPEMDYKVALKRLFDLGLSSLILLLGLPVWLLISFFVHIYDKGPVFYRQKRVGKNGRSFYMWKFRTMVVGAEKQLKNFKNNSITHQQHFKLKKDPRITGPGKILRRFSLDEFPQLFNVLKGDMSLVGPRPALHSEVDNYHINHMRRLSIKPGITGLWQVSGRNDLEEKTWLELDLRYIDEWSLLLDFKIILKTILVVLNGKGAY